MANTVSRAVAKVLCTCGEPLKGMERVECDDCLFVATRRWLERNGLIDSELRSSHTSPELLAAAEHQRQIHARLDAGEQVKDWRGASLRDSYERRFVPEHGMGLFSVNVDSGEVCDCKCVWVGDDVLLCPVCFVDGT